MKKLSTFHLEILFESAGQLAKPLASESEETALVPRYQSSTGKHRSSLMTTAMTCTHPQPVQNHPIFCRLRMASRQQRPQLTDPAWWPRRPQWNPLEGEAREGWIRWSYLVRQIPIRYNLGNERMLRVTCTPGPLEFDMGFKQGHFQGNHKENIGKNMYNHLPCLTYVIRYRIHLKSLAVPMSADEAPKRDI